MQNVDYANICMFDKQIFAVDQIYNQVNSGLSSDFLDLFAQTQSASSMPKEKLLSLCISSLEIRRKMT